MHFNFLQIKKQKEDSDSFNFRVIDSELVNILNRLDDCVFNKINLYRKEAVITYAEMYNELQAISVLSSYPIDLFIDYGIFQLMISRIKLNGYPIKLGEAGITISLR